MKKISLLILSQIYLCSILTAQVVDVDGIIFNEVNYDITTNNGGQWNGTGTTEGTLEFIEFYNSGASTVDIANWIIGDANSFRFQFNTNTRNIGVGESFILTDEIGTYTPPTNHFIYDVDDEGSLSGNFGMSNTGDCLFLLNPGADNNVGGNDDTWITFRYNNISESSTIYNGLTPSGTNNGTEVTSLDVEDQSIVRNPDITGTNWAGHLTLNATLACSPNMYVDGTTPLPVELSSFSASIINNGVRLNWRTETEVNNYGFEIEREVGSRQSAVGKWEKIGFVEGHGNSNSPKDYSFIDDKFTSGKFAYRLKQIDNDGTFEYSKIIKIDIDAPLEFELSQNYPNPFNPSTTIKFSLPVTSNVKLSVFNILGEEVHILMNDTKEAGIYTINFSARGGSAFGGDAYTLPSGIYFYKLETRNFIQVKKMSLIR